MNTEGGATGRAKAVRGGGGGGTGRYQSVDAFSEMQGAKSGDFRGPSEAMQLCASAVCLMCGMRERGARAPAEAVVAGQQPRVFDETKADGASQAVTQLCLHTTGNK